MTVGLLRRGRPRLADGPGAGATGEPAPVAARPAAIGHLTDREVATVVGTVRRTTVAPPGRALSLRAELADDTGALDLLWLGRRSIGAVGPGTRLRVHGRVCRRDGVPTIYNPRYEILPTRDR